MKRKEEFQYFLDIYRKAIQHVDYVEEYTAGDNGEAKSLEKIARHNLEQFIYQTWGIKYEQMK